MTKEEAITREEAIRRIKAWNLDSDDMEVLSVAIPELAESEDEKIRKLLVWQVHRNIEDETNDLERSVYDGIKGHDPDLEESIEDWKKCLDWLEKQKEQKPTEWSETEKNLYEWIYNLFERSTDKWFECVFSGCYPKVERESVLSWFKSLRPQPKQEWSEKDESIIEGACNALEVHGHPKLGSMLRSLKPHWKPSEEQMAALERTTQLANFGGEEDRRKALVSLYTDLKKLM